MNFFKLNAVTFFERGTVQLLVAGSRFGIKYEIANGGYQIVWKCKKTNRFIQLHHASSRASIAVETIKPSRKKIPHSKREKL